MKRTRRPRPPVTMLSGFIGFRFPPEVILLAVRWYLRYGLSYRDLEELLAERGIEVDHVTLYRWVQRFTPLLIDAARLCRHLAGDRWFVDETYVKVSGVWSYVYRAVDQRGQVIDVYVSQRRDIASARTFFTAALAVHGDPAEVITDRAPALANVIEDLVPGALHNTGQYENNRVECDHGRLKARLRLMRGLKTERTASVVIRGHAFVQNLRRGHYELAVDTAPLFRLATAFDEAKPADSGVHRREYQARILRQDRVTAIGRDPQATPRYPTRLSPGRHGGLENVAISVRARAGAPFFRPRAPRPLHLAVERTLGNPR